MDLFWGVILIIFTLLVCWLGQTITVFLPKLAVKLELTEPESDVDSTFYADVRGEAFWDMAILWTLPVAGLLLVVNSSLWAYFGLVGGGMYLYLAGRGIATRLVMQRRGIRIGKPETVKLYNAVLTHWVLIGVVKIIMEVSALPLP